MNSKRAQTLISSILLLIFLTATVPAWAWPPVFGPEFEFTTDALTQIERASGSNNLDVETDAAMQFSNFFIEHICPAIECRAEKVEGKYGEEWRFNFDYEHQGKMKTSYFQISWDPACVEVLMPPMTINQMRSAQEIVENALFGAAHVFGFKTSYDNANHVNMGIESTFEGDAELFLRSFIDHANHPEWDLGVLGFDIDNSPPLSHLRPEQGDALTAIVREFKKGKHQSIKKLIYEIQNRVYTKSIRWNADGGNIHYQAQGLKSIDEKKSRARIEYRGVWGQTSYEQFITYSEFRVNRVEYLRKQRKAGVPITFIASREKNPDVGEALEKFGVELDKMELSRKTYSILVNPRLIDFYSFQPRTCEAVFH